MMPKTTSESFLEYFEIVSADTEPLKQAAYALRYQVYCLETGFENPEDYPEGQERDEYDDYSRHYLIRHRHSGEYAATVRLILPDGGDDGRPFPMELHSRIDDPAYAAIPRRALAEVSRFCVSKSFKRRRGELGTLAGISEEAASGKIFSEHERRTFPYITVGLIGSFIWYAHENGLAHLCAAMEPALIRFLVHLGIYFRPVGPLIDYHGLRRPCVIELEALMCGVQRQNPEVWELMGNRGLFLGMR